MTALPGAVYVAARSGSEASARDDMPSARPFIGRTEELAEGARLLEDTRVLSIVGPPGIGKTRIAIELARAVAAGYLGGVGFVPLASVCEPQLISQVVSAALGLRDDGNRPFSTPEALGDSLSNYDALIVFDNCEHLLEPGRRIISAALERSASVKFISTTQAPLGLAAEVVWRIPPLSLPDDDRDPLSSDAIRLFVERARGTDPSFVVEQADLPALVDVCRALDGLPLAIELAASRTRVLTVTQLRTRLEDRFAVLRQSAPTPSARHESLERAIQWSYELLTENEKTLLTRLSIFGDSFTLDSAEYVCSAPPLAEGEILDLLDGLLQKSLISVGTGGHAGTRRFVLLQSVADFARRQLVDGEAHIAARRHAEYYARLSEQSRPRLRGDGSPVMLELIDAEVAELRKAIRWTREAAELGLHQRIAGSVWWYWFRRGYWTEGRNVVDDAVDAGGESANLNVVCGAAWFAALQNDYPRALSLVAHGLARVPPDDRDSAGWLRAVAAEVAWYGRDFEAARAQIEASIDAYKDNANRWGVAWGLRLLGLIDATRGEYAAARATHQESLDLFRQLNESWGIAWELYFLASLAKSIGSPGEAATLCQEGADLFASIGDGAGAAHIRQEYAEVLLQTGDWAEARSLFKESLSALDAMGDLNCAIASVIGLGMAATRAAVSVDALQYFKDALRRCKDIHSLAGAAWALQGLSEIVTFVELWSDVALLLGAIEGLRDAASSPAAPYIEWQLRALRRTAADAVGVVISDDAFQRGRGMTFEEAMAEVDALLPHVHVLVRAKASLDDPVGETGRRWVGEESCGALLELVNAYRGAFPTRRLAAALEDAGWSLRRQDPDKAAELLNEAVAIHEMGDGASNDVARISKKLRDMGIRRGSRGRRGRPASGWEALTPTELRVAGLVAEGLANPKIAERLFVSRRTVDSHLSHIFDKLNISSRAQLAGEVARRRS